MSRDPSADAPPTLDAEALKEAYPFTRLTVREQRCADDDEDLLFLFLSENEVFLKLTRHCNNHCRFCCDTVFWNGSNMSLDRVRAKITEGAQRGYQRLFLSGGEPTIHPDYVEIVGHGKAEGYLSIITITNGRMFFYPEFAAAAVAAGLTGVVVACNSHEEQTHDSLVSVKGAYRQTRWGIANLKRLGCPFNLSAVVNRQNVEQLPEMVRSFHRWGAGAVTFMQLIPNDRDWARSRNTIYYELGEGREPVRAALRVAQELDFAVELKKFPDPFFEDFEEQIQEPLNWALEVAEIDWRRPERFAPYRDGEPVQCHGERCDFCAYRPFCAYLMRHQALRREGGFDGFELGPGELKEPLASSVAQALDRQPETPVRLCEADVAAVEPWLSTFGERGLSVQLEQLDGIEGLPEEVAVVVTDDTQLERVWELPHDVEVWLNVLTADWLLCHVDWVRDKGAGLTLTPQYFLRLETARRGQVELPEVLRRLPLDEVRLRAVPPCLSGREDTGRLPHVVTGELLARVEDVPAHARHYYWQRYLTKSQRCEGCRVRDRCDGAHINYVRQFGYRALRPQG
ncbi:MAG: radical SAM protein [bacterium]